MISGISIREEEVKVWLNVQKFKGEYLLVSTKPESIYSKKLAALKTDQKLIVDLYTPIFLEKELTLSKWKPQDWLTRFRNKEMVKKFLRRGNHFLVANHRQREYWLKIAQGLGITLEVNDISVFPTGSGQFQISNLKFPVRLRMDEVQAGGQISKRKNVVLWFGGIYPWMDPQPLIEAFSQVSSKFPEWKLRFLGGFHPNTGYKDIYRKVELLAKAKISDYQLEFIPWQPEKNLNKYFVDVAFAAHLPKKTPEDYYAHRVRLLTLFSAGIPVITAGNDTISELAVSFGAASKTKLDRKNVEKDLIYLMNSTEQLNKMSRLCSKVEKEFIKQETDIKLNDSNHLILRLPHPAVTGLAMMGSER